MSGTVYRVDSIRHDGAVVEVDHGDGVQYVDVDFEMDGAQLLISGITLAFLGQEIDVWPYFGGDEADALQLVLEQRHDKYIEDQAGP